MSRCRRFGAALAVAHACVALGATYARATVHFVDGACATSGTGVSATCGSSGPLRTITEGIQTIAPGDTLDIRGAHGGFSGIYREQVTLAAGENVPGSPLPCTQAAPCIIQGHAGDPPPHVRGSRRYTDWQALGGGVYVRVAELAPTGTGSVFNRDSYEPEILLFTLPDGSLAELPNAGENVALPPDGTWSFWPASHEIHVNPPGNADATGIEVPYYQHALLWRLPTEYVTLQGLVLEVARFSVFESWGHPTDGGINGLVLRNLSVLHTPRFLIHMANGAVAPLFEDLTLQYGARGNSQPNHGDNGAYALRLFMVHGIQMRRVHVAHLGSMGRTAPGPQYGGPYLDPPWNDPTATEFTEWGHCVNIKQTHVGTVEDLDCEDFAENGVILDCADNVTVTRTSLRRGRGAVSIRDQTPAGPYTHCFADVFDTMRIETIVPPAGSSLQIVNTNINGSVPLVDYRNLTFVDPVGPMFAPPSGTGITITGTQIVSGGSTTSTTTSTTTSSTQATTTTTVLTTMTSTTRSSTTTATSTTTSSTRSSTTQVNSSTSTSTTTLMVGACGDGAVDAGEECDGPDAPTCPGLCRPDCTCPCPNVVVDPTAVVRVSTRRNAGKLIAKMVLDDLKEYAGEPVMVRLDDADSIPIVLRRVGALPVAGTSHAKWRSRTKGNGLLSLTLKEMAPRHRGRYLLHVKARAWFTAAQANEPAASTDLTVTIGGQCFTHVVTKKVF